MAIELRRFIQASLAESTEMSLVSEIAGDLLDALNIPETLAKIREANQPKRSSSEVQAAFRNSALALHFESERAGLFQDSITGLRPDYYRRIGDSGIILEVERGKTTTNNMDLLDFWKCHLCGSAHYLFLLVPKELRHNHGMSPKREFDVVSRRLARFFEPNFHTNVRGLFLFGY